MKVNSITLLGDIAFTGILSTEPEKNKERFKEVIPILAQSDFVFANLEVPVKVDESRNENKNRIYYSLPVSTEELLKLLNIGCVALANNHIYDCKMPGLKATINILDKLGIYHTGAGWLPKHIEPVIINSGDNKIGFLSYVDQSTNTKTENFPKLYINYFSINKVKTDIKNIRNKVDKIILSIHWGIDYSHYQTPEQVSIARELIDTGTDIIMGHHPHTLQPFERYKNGAIFYSLGGLTFGDYINEEKLSLQAVFRKTKKGLITQYGLRSNSFNFISTKEQKGNYICITKKNFTKWSAHKWSVYYLKNKSNIIRKVVRFKEKILDSVVEYFFGYYQNPVKRLFQFSNIKKIKRLYKQ